ncbi:MAG: hypothetical protein ACOYBL_03375 [Lachnospiraceae bacterium]|jgi:hypothetical protein
MRKYKSSQIEQLEQVCCNQCGKALRVENGIIMEGVFHGAIDWGYFSDYDGESHSFDLCEDCYKKMISKFQIPVTKEQKTELL